MGVGQLEKRAMSNSPLNFSLIEAGVVDACARSRSVDDVVTFRSTISNESSPFGFDGRIGDRVVLSCTFFLAYSTWDGRFMYLDDLMTNLDDDCKDESMLLSLAVTFLAKISVTLGCSRLTWRRRNPLPLTSALEPSFMGGWLTVFWEVEAMKRFLECGDGPMDLSKQIDMLAKTSNRFSLRTAGIDDAEDIMELVQGLADYEKEPDAVNVTSEVYRVDGFGDYPLFQCFLLGRKDEPQSPACGMALYYAAQSKRDGTFLYLDDLFIQETQRKGGGGTLLMKAIASAALSSGAQRVVWQVLDWNTPARVFYQSIGACIQDGLGTFRYETQRLHDVVATLSP